MKRDPAHSNSFHWFSDQQRVQYGFLQYSTVLRNGEMVCVAGHPGGPEKSAVVVDLFPLLATAENNFKNIK